MGLILDTNFILWAGRESKSGETRRLERFFAPGNGEYFFITFTLAGELACGRSASPQNDWERLCRPYPILPWSRDVSWQYGEIYRFLAARGNLMGANDMSIAATAVVDGMGVVTNNLDEFHRVPGLSVIAY